MLVTDCLQAGRIDWWAAGHSYVDDATISLLLSTLARSPFLLWAH